MRKKNAMACPGFPSRVTAVFDGWRNHNGLIVDALKPLTAEQLALSAAPKLRPIERIAAHMIGARARWFHVVLGEGGDAFAKLGRWDRRGARSRTAAELVEGLETTYAGMQAAITRWTADDWLRVYDGDGPNEPAGLTPPWVLWHLIEHDIHHGGEISLTLGAHRLRAPHL